MARLLNSSGKHPSATRKSEAKRGSYDQVGTLCSTVKFVEEEERKQSHFKEMI